jgi:general stress protein 26
MHTEEGKLRDIVEGFSTGTLVTRTASGEMHARPLAMLLLREKASGAIYFATDIDSPKVAEILGDPNVLVTFQDEGRWAVVHGVATVERNQAVIDQLWSDDLHAFFPDGPADKSLCILAIRPTTGEYWDDRDTARLAITTNRLFALATGRKLRTNEAHDHARISVRPRQRRPSRR